MIAKINSRSTIIIRNPKGEKCKEYLKGKEIKEYYNPLTKPLLPDSFISSRKPCKYSKNTTIE